MNNQHSMEYLHSDSGEWDEMWQQLAQEPRNDGDPLCVHRGNCWEYMGSTADHHHFRHACHPASDSIEYAYLERRRIAAGWR